MKSLFVRSLRATQQPALPVVVLHGLLGSSRNWLGFAKDRLQGAVPQLDVSLLDLRNHGQSEGFAAPHTLASCVDDIAATSRAHALATASFIGHSMGGKVLLKLLDTHDAARAFLGHAPGRRLDVFVIDTFPGSLPQSSTAAALDGVEQVLTIVNGAPHPIPSRQWVVEKATSAGLDKGTALWLASNVTQCDHADGIPHEQQAAGFRWMFDPATAAGLFTDYMAYDCWSLLLNGPPVGVNLHLVMAAKSTRWQDAGTRAQLERVRSRQAARDAKEAAGGGRESGTVHLHTVKAGHWIHVDNPQGLADVLVPALRARAALL